MTVTEALLALGVTMLGTKELWAMLRRLLHRRHAAAADAAELVQMHTANDKVSLDAAALAVATAKSMLETTKEDLDATRAELRDARIECERLVVQARNELATLGQENARLQIALNDCLGARANTGGPQHAP